MKQQEIDEIREKSNKLIHKKFPQLENHVKDGVVEAILETMNKLGWKIRRSK